ncbi:MAG: PAS domain S-box protein [Xanthobacteraceae bacterium]|nr:MAG: PAS domain S-box protein [Xanthobacteraceae bacterium]
MKTPSLTGNERRFRNDEIIVSKTDLKGRITYCNDVFIRISGYSEKELIGQPHSIIRHPAMPRCVFKLLWDTIAKGDEVFAYVLNLSKNGDHYWVFAHVTPDVDYAGAIMGYHSSRRSPDDRAIAAIRPLYDALLAEEARHPNGKNALEASTEALVTTLGKKGIGYDRFVLGL